MNKKNTRPISKKTSKSKKEKSYYKNSQHPDYSNLVPNLNRVAGQIEGIKKMITERRYCIDILQQLKSIKSAIGGIESSIIENYMDCCVMAVFNSRNQEEKVKKISELKNLYRRF